MDKVKLVIAHLKKQHFWVLCVLVVLTALVAWDLATSSLDDRYNAAKDRGGGQVQRRRGREDHGESAQ